MTKHCTLEDCSRKHYAENYCRKHHSRLKRNGSLELKINRYQSLEEAFERGVSRVEGQCWSWQGTKTTRGYATIYFRDKALFAHRVSYEASKGEIPEGMLIDHICHTLECTNPEHLRLATKTQNTLNRLLNKNSRTGVPNVTKTREGNFQVRLSVEGKQRGFGTYPTLEEASEVAEQTRKKYYGEFANVVN